MNPKERAYKALELIEEILTEKCQNEFGTHGAKILTDVVREALEKVNEALA